MRVPTHYLNGFISFAEAHGASRQELLKEAAVSQETLDDPDARIEYAQFKLLIQRAVARSGSPALGIRLAAQLPITTHGLLGYAAMSSGTLEEALSFVTRFVPTRIPVLVAELSVDKGVCDAPPRGSGCAGRSARHHLGGYGRRAPRDWAFPHAGQVRAQGAAFPV